MSRDGTGGAGALTRRAFLAGLGAAGGGAILGACSSSRNPTAGRTSPTTTRLKATASTLAVGERPNLKAAAGSDQLPQFDHFVICMLENHSFDNMIGTIERGDGLTLGGNGLPTNTNPYGKGKLLRAFHMPTECQQVGHPSQDWNASHQQYDAGTCQGFAESASGPVAMGYYDASDMPFTSGLARTFPISDRWFCSVLAQTLPNRRYLLAGTSLGLINDDLLDPLPPNGTILQQFNRHGISWRNYYSNEPSIYCWPGLLPVEGIGENVAAISDFYTDCANGSLPQFSLVDPNFSVTSEEDPQDVQKGDVFLAGVVNAVMSSPSWDRILFMWTYDEHGGYYDHVPPPPAPTPDGVPPDLTSTDVAGSFDRFGFRVPMGVVSAYARPDYVSHTICDHTSMLKLLETKWNLPTLTRRDAAANDFLDMVDFGSPPAFAKAPKLPAPADPALRECSPGQAGTIPPPSAVLAS
ncbi:MAG: alkaline phosphatase family protein [Acidimicrobiales bacterium]